MSDSAQSIHNRTIGIVKLRIKILEFIEYLAVEKGSSPLTLRNYNHYLKRFSEFLGREATVTDITADKVRSFRMHLSQMPDGHGSTLAKQTQGYHIIALRSFLKWLARNDYDVLSAEKLDLPKYAERQVKFLNSEQVERLLNAPSQYGLAGKRDKAIMEVLFSTGLRVSELVKLDRDKVDLNRREFGVVGKGGRARVVFLSNRAAEWVKRYVDARDDHYTPLFIRHHGKVDPATPDEKTRLTVRSVQRLIKKYARKMQLPVDVTPHVMRHSFATDLLIAGADIRSVQEMLGHKNIQTTQIYTHVTNKHLKDIHEAFHGKGK